MHNRRNNLPAFRGPPLLLASDTLDGREGVSGGSFLLQIVRQFYGGQARGYRI